jgi:hypothetical protein
MVGPVAAITVEAEIVVRVVTVVKPPAADRAAAHDMDQ